MALVEVEDQPLNSSRAMTHRDPRDWAAHTISHLHDSNALREEVKNQLRRQHIALNSSAEEPSIGGPVVEDKLKQRARETRGMFMSLVSGVERLQQSIYSLRQKVSECNRAAGTARLALSVVEKRLDLRRNKRPPEENTQDGFNEALEAEKEVLLKAIDQLHDLSDHGRSMMKPLIDSKAEMHQARLTVHMDRTGRSHEQLAHAYTLEKSAAQFASEAEAVLREYERSSEKARAGTASSMKKRIADILALKVHLEKDLAETDDTIHEVERHLLLLERRLNAALAMPERKHQAEGAEVGNSRLTAKSERLTSIRAKIKSMAYTGAAGRQLDVVFARFDRDGSGHLDEDEVRMALRKTCKIPPSVITDAEVSVLCNLLDEDHSGAVSISELVDFLTADTDVAALEEQCSATRASLDRLRAARAHAAVDLHNKTLAWRCDEACIRVTPARGMELDHGIAGNGSPGWSNQANSGHAKASNAPGRAGTCLPAARSTGRKRPLDPAVVERVRTRMRAAAAAGSNGKNIDTFFVALDKRGVGLFTKEELRIAMRKTMRIPTTLISDADFGALCEVLDADQTGGISIARLVDFVTQAPSGPRNSKVRAPGSARSCGSRGSTRSAGSNATNSPGGEPLGPQGEDAFSQLAPAGPRSSKARPQHTPPDAPGWGSRGSTRSAGSTATISPSDEHLRPHGEDPCASVTS